MSTPEHAAAHHGDHGHDPVALEPERFSFPPLAKIACFGAIVAGLIVFAIAFFIDREVAFMGWTVAAWYGVGLSLFATVFLSYSHLSSAGWHTVLKRVPEAMMQYLPYGLITFVIVAAGATWSNLYEWTHPHDDGSVHAELIQWKAPWLNLTSWLVRMVIYFAIWISLSMLLVRASRKQDTDGDVKHTGTGRKVGAIYCFLFAITVTFAGIDWVMSVEPTWFSTMFGVYQFAGIVESGFAATVLLLIFLRRSGYLRHAVNENHLHNLGIWLLAAATFWAYIWFCQFMLIWYSNIPEETQHFYARWEGPWFYVSFVVNPLLNWVLPFLILLPRPNKRDWNKVALAAVIALAGRWVDLWQFMAPRPHHDPLTHTPHATVGVGSVFTIAIMVSIAGLFVYAVLKALEKAPLLAKKDPYFEESVHHHL